MEVREVKQQIKQRRISPFYVFTGDEIEAQRIYIEKIAEVTGKQVRRIESVSEAFNRRASILRVSNVFVCRDDKDFWRSATELSVVEELLGDNILGLQMTAIDKRSKSSKAYSERTVEFNYMDADVLYKYTERACRLSDDRAYDLIDMCENDYSRILLECNKINRYAQATGAGVDNAFDKLVEEKAITRPPKDAIFDFTDALLRAQIDRAFSLLEECRAIGEPSLRILSVLYSNFRRVLAYQVSESRDICAETGLTPFEVKLAKATSNVWSSEDIVYFLRNIQQIEQGIKTGEVDESIAVDLLMVQIL